MNKLIGKRLLAIVLIAVLVLGISPVVLADEEVTLPDADIVDVVFNADGTCTDAGDYNAVLTMTGGSVGNVSVDHANNSFTTPGYVKTADNQAIKIDLSAYKNDAEFKVLLIDGYTMETAFCLDTMSDATVAPFSCTQGGGVGIYISKDTGKFFFDQHNGTGYTRATGGNVVEAGEWYHVLAVYDQTAAETRLYINGVLTDTAAVSPNALSFGSASFIWGLGADTNDTGALEYLTKSGAFTCARIYSDAMNGDQAKLAYKTQMQLSDTPPEADIVDLVFNSDGTATDAGDYNATLSVYNGGTVGRAQVSHKGVEHTTTGFQITAPNQAFKVDLSAYKTDTDFTAMLTDGYTLETAFSLESIPATIIGLFSGTQGGMFGLYLRNGLLELQHKTSGDYAKSIGATAIEAGEWYHVVAVYDKVAATLNVYLNGALEASVAVSPNDMTPGSGSFVWGLGADTDAAGIPNECMSPPGIFTRAALYSDALTEGQAKTLYTSAVSSMQEYDDFDAVLRFAVASDIHIKNRTSAEYTRFGQFFSKSYAYAQNQSYQNVDLFAVVGDLADDGTVAQWEIVDEIIAANLDENESAMLLTMGNHDFYSDRHNTGAYPSIISGFETTTGQTFNSHKVIGGYHFIGISPHHEMYTADTLNWLRQELAAAAADDPAKPIFVFQHHHVRDTVLGSEDSSLGWGVAGLNEIFDDYPQVIDFSGHSHYPLNDESSVYQDLGFTAVGTATLSYLARMYDGANAIDAPNKEDVAQYWFVEVDAANNVRLRAYDLITEEIIEEYIITAREDGFHTEDFLYTADRFDDLSVFFEDGAAITQESVSDTRIKVSFPQFSAEGLSASTYRIEVIDDDAEAVVHTSYIASQYYLGSRMPASLTASVPALTPGTDYTLKIYGLNSLNIMSVNDAAKVSQPLTLAFTTTGSSDPNAPLPAADIFDMGINAGTVSDISPNPLTVTAIGTPTILFDDAVRMDVVKFTSSTSYKADGIADYYEDMAYTFSEELFFKLDSLPASGYASMLCNMQNGGYGFEVFSDGTFQFSIYKGSYVKTVSAVEAGVWYHALAVYDGATLKLYMNGGLVSETVFAAPASMTSVDPAKNLFINGDSSANGNGESMGDCTIGIGRIYSGALNAGQVKEAAQLAFSTGPARDIETVEVTGTPAFVPLNTPLKLTGAMLRVTYDDGFVTLVPLTADMLDAPLDTTIEQKATLTGSYESFSFEFDVTVTSITTNFISAEIVDAAAHTIMLTFDNPVHIALPGQIYYSEHIQGGLFQAGFDTTTYNSDGGAANPSNSALYYVDPIYVGDVFYSDSIIMKFGQITNLTTMLKHSDDLAVGALLRITEYHMGGNSEDGYIGSVASPVVISYQGAVLSGNRTETMRDFAVQTLVNYVPRAVAVTLPTGTGFTAAAYGGDSTQVTLGGSFRFTVTPAAAYNQSQIIVKANGAVLTAQNGVYTLTNVMAAQTITVEGVALNQYSVILETAENGTVTASAGTVAHGGSVTLTLTPKDGYVLSEVLVNGSPVEKGATITLANVTRDMTVKAVFVPAGSVPPTADTMPLVLTGVVLLLSLAAAVMLTKAKKHTWS